MWKKIVDFFSLFGSTATLFCCALPALLSVLVGGAAVSSFVSVFPWIVPLSEHKAWLFLVAGALIFISGMLTLRPKGKLACSISGGRGCETAGAFTKSVFWISVVLYACGAFAAYGLTPLLMWLEG